MEFKQKKGISLIVLVITILVMIILAAAIILELTGNDIFGNADDAVNETELASFKEAVQVEYINWQALEELKKTDKEPLEYIKQKLSNDFSEEWLNKIEITESGKIVIEMDTETSKPYTIYTDSEKRTAPIPNGFTVSSIPEETTIDGGLVIIDNDGNEFVWIPVSDISNFVEKDWGSGLTGTNFTVEQCNLTNSAETEEYAALKESIEEYKGFYIARYEAGLPAGVTKDTANYGQKNDGTEITKPVSMKGAAAWYSIPWGTTDTSSYGTWDSLGAAKVAREAYSNSNSVVSHLIYGVEWDAALNFISEKDSTYPLESREKGNYTGSLEETGYYAINNIYDMAGNLFEYTMEAYSFNNNYYRVARGGYYDYFEYVPTAYRRLVSGASSNIDIGFRLALYIKLDKN